MYFVDRNKIEQTLQFLEQQCTLFKQQEKWEALFEKKVLERIGHLVIECILDVGNAMIDGFIMRDPGSYDDIIDILMDERVIPEEEGEELKQVIRLRKSLVQDYINVDHTEAAATLNRHMGAIEQFPLRVRRYLENELGPVSAFKN
ncbi:DUF86 domain-containing protein [Priestia abyssalis]|uniref:DUF86 domain-containing protein n=1 Tax=Priestia abyssalis TaxID=1221450 RepID=UPI000994AAFC|nr:DUF86 domain-containing protein [Priestia abyssalis]